MKRILVCAVVVALSIAICYVGLFLGVFADFLFLGIGASASTQQPIFPIVFPVLHIIVATLLFFKRKVIDNIFVYLVCISIAVILLYVHVLSGI